VDVGVVLELSTPSVEDAGKAGEVGTDKALFVSEPFEGVRRGCEHSLVGEALMRADEGSELLRDGEGEEEVRCGQLFFELVMEPLLGFMMLALWTVPVSA
jgi:hypothetical protein